MPRTRQDVWKIKDDTLKWYARAVAAMQKRPVTDPTSWRYQGAIHGYDPAQDPFARSGEKLPSSSEQSTYWSRCQHGSWFFLPWHRGYLHYFEQILLKAIKDLGGPSDWALPYWNYSDHANPNARCLPRAFYDPKFPDGGPNPLLVKARAEGANDGDPLGSALSADITTCLKKLSYINSSGGAGSNFGGGRTGFSHRGGVPGALELTPHGSMHDAVGGDDGWMESFETAALDPIFWCHHSNIDRLWEVWRKRDPRHTNPTLAAWLSSIDFDFHDADGKPVTLEVNQVLDTTSPMLDYVYQDVSDPLGAPHRVAEAASNVPMEIERIPEMVGATDNKEINLGAQPNSVEFPVKPPSGPAARARMAAGAAAAPEIHLNLENVTAEARPIQSYVVYVNLPEGANAANYPQLVAGLLPKFGIVEASRESREHAGDGMNYSFDITQIVNTLQQNKQWNPERVRVTFVPHQPETKRAIAPNTKPVKVGRISLYYA
ncbi:MAG TPA: tyrosinase family protein [Candidatus Angelobacter sp.]|nr:tyrosinase family protein [Candidatus Angelobacter sp.]